MEPSEWLFDPILSLFDGVKRPVLKAVLQILAMTLFTALLIFVLLALATLMLHILP